MRDQINYFTLLRRYVQYARIEPDESFSTAEQCYLRDMLHTETREKLAKRWNATQKTSTRRIRAFLVNYSEHWFSKRELELATGDKPNTVCSALQRLTKRGLVKKVAYDRYTIEIRRWA